MPIPPDDDPNHGRVLTILLVTAAVIAALYLLLGRRLEPVPSPDLTAPATIAAKRWADTAGIRLTGVTCDSAGRCTIVPSAGVPYLVLCDPTTCRAESCPR